MINLLNKFISLGKKPFLIPFYHMVSDDKNSFVKYLYPPRKIENFKKDLDVLLKYYTPISLDNIVPLSQSKEVLNKPCFHLTFDDGLSNFYNIVAPILEEKKIPTTVFINTDFVDNKELFYRYKASLLIQRYEKSCLEVKEKYYVFFGGKKEVKKLLLKINYNNQSMLDELALIVGLSFEDFLKKEKPYLTTVQIKDLIKRGFTIGAHSINHPLYADISLKEQITQTKESLVWLQQNLNLKYNAFAFPFNDLGVTKEFFLRMKGVLDVSFGTAGIKKDNFATNFQRISFELADYNIKRFLIKEYFKYLLKVLLRKNNMPRS